jgi:DNA-binding winged helix-turn-helix (wHTH) protein
VNDPEPLVYEFDDFRIDAGRRLLTQRGASVPLNPKVFDTLLYLALHQGRLLEKDELMRSIWPDTVVEENSLNQCVSTLRRALGERPGENRYIITVPGRGYRFAAIATAITNGTVVAEATGICACTRRPPRRQSACHPSARRSRWSWLGCQPRLVVCCGLFGTD